MHVLFNLDPVFFLKKAEKQNWDFIFGALPQVHEVIQLHPCRAQIVLSYNSIFQNVKNNPFIKYMNSKNPRRFILVHNVLANLFNVNHF